jgi:DNA-binding NarL/FixJ family response regulator
MLLDSNAVALESVTSLVAHDPSLKIVCRVLDWWTAIRMMPECRPDVCIMDVSRHDLDGVIATRRLKQVVPDLKVIALAEDHDLHGLERLLGAGINAYILKRKAAAELIPAIHAVVTAGVYLGEAASAETHHPESRTGSMP